MFKTILLIESDDVLKEFFSRVFYIDGFEVIFINDEKEVNGLSKLEVESIDLVVIDESKNPKSFTKSLRKLCKKNNITKNIPILGVLKKGVDPEAAHKSFDAVMIKDNFNIQLLADLVERLTSESA